LSRGFGRSAAARLCRCLPRFRPLPSRAVSNEAPNSDGPLQARLYRERFTEEDLEFKRRMWAVLCDRVFQRYVSTTDTLLDLGAGSCEFTNAIRAGHKIAVDLNPATARYARDARFVQASGTDMSVISSDSVDVIFCSNFMEHLPDKAAVLQTLRECHRVLRPGGKLLILQPNIRYLPGRFWDYFDHFTPLTHLSMVEALRLASFVPLKVLPRFLPYTVKGTRLVRSTLLVRMYLRFPVAWPILGRQMLILAEAKQEAQQTVSS
jgi:SAM-dependent methyltransferase